MKSVKIKADLERRLRAAPDNALAQEVVALLDEKVAAKPQGMGYKELVGLFRQHLGAALAIPPNPSVGWIARQVIRARDIGLDVEYIQKVCGYLQKSRVYKPPYDLDFILRNATRFLSDTEPGPGTGDSQVRVVVGRPDYGDSD